ncbi:hypothetical protein [Streptomyces sp. NPDC055036]
MNYLLVRIRQRMAAVAACQALLLAGLVTIGAPAHAAVGDLICTAQIHLVNDPGITTLPLEGKPTAVTLTGNLSGCISLNGTHTNLVSASIDAGLTGDLGCGPAGSGPVTGTGTFNWLTTTGAHQHSNFTISLVSAAGTHPNQVITGSITSGTLAGDSFIEVAAPIANVGDCNTPEGITSSDAVGLFTFQ